MTTTVQPRQDSSPVRCLAADDAEAASAVAADSQVAVGEAEPQVAEVPREDGEVQRLRPLEIKKLKN